MSDRQFCKNCFRVAPVGLTSCNLHSQSKFVVDEKAKSRSSQSHSARVARRVRELVGSPQWTRYAELPNGLPEDAIAGILWPLRGEQHATWNQAVSDALHGAPLVKQLLPMDFLRLRNHDQLAILRNAIDENQWQIGRWPETILLAQRWFEAEAEILRSTCMAAQRAVNDERLRQADALRATNVAPSAIALQLGISRSHLSQLWRRRKRRR